MLANEAWDFFITNQENEKLIKEDSKLFSDAALFLMKEGSIERSGSDFSLTESGTHKYNRLLKSLNTLSRGIPIASRRGTVPKHFLLRRDYVTAKWLRGRAGRVSELGKLFTFMTDRCILLRGTKLLNEPLTYESNLYLHFFPVKKESAILVDSLILDAISIKPKLLIPYCYQRTRLSNPGIVWMKDLDNNLYPVAASYYDYLVSWSDRVRYEHKFGFVELNGKRLVVLECKHAPTIFKFKGDVTAIVALMTTKELPDADLS